MKKLIPWLLALPLLGACDHVTWDATDARDGTIEDVEVSTSPETLALGGDLYTRYCAGCHGVNGDGQGPSAHFMQPSPRDFRVGLIKFAQVESGKAPRDSDYLRVITNGLQGTAMPAFPFLPIHERRALVAYVKTFRTEKAAKKRSGVTLTIPRDPFQRKPDKGIREGERMYHGLAACHSCHPAYASYDEISKHRASYDLKAGEFRTGLYAPLTKDSDWGAPITPPDFLTDPIKTGDGKDTIVRVVAAGVGGTAMPTWAATLTPRQIWGLAYYVEYLASLRGTQEGDDIMARLRGQGPPPPKPEPAPKPAPPPEPDETQTDAGAAGGGSPEGAPAASSSAATPQGASQ